MSDTQIIAIICEKGGVGKTTIALSLAVAAAKAGKSVALIDIDTQPTATNWGDRREAQDLAILSAQPARRPPTIEAARRSGADLVIIDTAGKNEAASIAAVRAADLVLVPMTAKPKAMETLPRAREIITAGGSPPAYVVLNFIHPQGGRAADKLKELLFEAYGIEACPVHFTQRALYDEADLTGRTPQELDPQGKAATEAQDLYLFVKKQRSACYGLENRKVG